jgi:hypothetical protein
MAEQEFWQPWLAGPTGTNIQFLGPSGAVTGPAFYGVTGATGPTGSIYKHEHMKFLYDNVRIRMAGASDAMIRSVIYEVLHEFFNDSSVWREIIPGNLQPYVLYYWLEPGNPLSPLFDPQPKGEIIGIGAVFDFNGFPLGADMPEPPVMRLQFAQSSPLPVWVTTFKNVRVPHGSELPEVPASIIRMYETWLMAGVIGKLQLQDNRPYSDPKMGILNYQTFRQGVNIARVRAMRMNTVGGQAWQYPQQFRTVSQRGGVSVGNYRVF